MKPSTEKVLQALRAAGDRGVLTGELLHGGCGSRYGARIAELRGMGFEISTERIRQGSSRYILVSAPAGSGGNRREGPPAIPHDAPNAARSSRPEGQLFDAEAFRPRPQHDRLQEVA